MNSKYLIVLTLLLCFLCQAYSQRLNINDKKQINIKCLTAYNKWRSQNRRNYLNPEEQLFRQLVFLDNLQTIEDHNSNPKKTYNIGTNQFADMTPEEFASRVLNNHAIEENRNLQVQQQGTTLGAYGPIAKSIDWRTKGAISEVKNQGRCGSCWAFASTAMVESYNFIQNGKLQSFSEQQLLDCAVRSNGFSTYGCQGGNAYSALSYFQQYGAVDQASYPYVGIQGKCQVTAPTNGYKPKTFVKLDRNVDALKAALNKSPITVAVDASLWMMYQSGVITNCVAPILNNHLVLVVGYDEQGNWIIKNSWGSKWGDSGFVKTAGGDFCGMTLQAYTITS